LNNVGKIVV